jgi:hypothetical protein
MDPLDDPNLPEISFFKDEDFADLKKCTEFLREYGHYWAAVFANLAVLIAIGLIGWLVRGNTDLNKPGPWWLYVLVVGLLGLSAWRGQNFFVYLYNGIRWLPSHTNQTRTTRADAQMARAKCGLGQRLQRKTDGGRYKQDGPQGRRGPSKKGSSLTRPRKSREELMPYSTRLLVRRLRLFFTTGFSAFLPRTISRLPRFMALELRKSHLAPEAVPCFRRRVQRFNLGAPNARRFHVQ